MKRIYFALFLLISVISFNCQKELGGGPGSGPVNGNTSPITATLQGNILDENGQPAMGVTVKAGSKTATTNAKGYFRIVNASLDKKTALVTAEKNGYFKAYRSFSATSGVNQVVIKLIRKNLVGTVNAASGGDATLSNGTKISLPSGGVVNSSGASYSGTINVYSAYIDPTTQDIAQTIPGSLTADDKNNERVTLTSYGMVAVELQSTSGEKLQIASGKEATLTMPIPASIQSSAPATISLWYVDEQTGIWKEEGTATKTGSNYVGQVKHFSFWNCDVSSTAILLSMTLQTSDGEPLVHALVKLTRSNGSSSYGWTDSLGQVSGHVPSNETLSMQVLAYPCNTAIYSQNIGPFTQNTNLGVITVSNPGNSIITLQGKLLNCSSSPVTNGFAIIYYDNFVRYAATDNNGNFSTTLITCTGSPTTCQVLGVDNGAQQQGAMTNVTLASPVTNAGNISACGNSSLQYINYNIDGINYSISSAIPADSLTCHTYDSISVVGTYISGAHMPNDFISFNFNSSGVAGTYPLGSLYVQGSYASLIQPFNVTVTSFPAVAGGFYEGSFAGQYTSGQPVTTHTITCSFRMRR